MKIGAFCKYFNISDHTVRFYIHKGLLVPEVRNTQYYFTQDSMFDLELILQMKKCGFTLDKIHEIVSLYRISRFAASKDLKKIQEMFLVQQVNLNQELLKTQNMSAEIGLYIQELTNENDEHRRICQKS